MSRRHFPTHVNFNWDSIDYVQLADHPGRNEPGTCCVHDNNRVLQALDRLGYRGYVGLELIPLTSEAEAAEAVARAAVWRRTWPNV